jgi:hypothetical protein
LDAEFPCDHPRVDVYIATFEKAYTVNIENTALMVVFSTIAKKSVDYLCAVL